MTADTFLGFLEDVSHRRKRRRLACDLPADDLTLVPAEAHPLRKASDEARISRLPPAKRRKAEAYSLDVYLPELEAMQRDFSQEYVNSSRRPVNFVLGAELEHRFDEYPKLRRLLDLHSELVLQHAHTATHMTTDMRSFDLSALLPVRYDAILIDAPTSGADAWSWSDLEALPVPSIAANPSFIWIWVGSGCQDGLEKGRALLAKWGYRRCEDIVWLKTNKQRPDFATEPSAEAIFTNTKEHCLMGIRGTVRRSTDAHYVHCNVDTDVIFAEEDPADPSKKPVELLNLIENFCLGTRRLHLFAPPSFARPGWLAVGSRFDSIEGTLEYDKATYDSYFDNSGTPFANIVPNTPEVDALRPRTPPPAGQRNQSQAFAPRGPPPVSRPLPVGPLGLPARPSSMPQQHPPFPIPPHQQAGLMRPAPPLPQRPHFHPQPMAHLPPQAHFTPQPMGMSPPMHHLSPPIHHPIPPQALTPPPPAGPLDLDALAGRFGGWANVVAGAGRGRGGPSK